MPESTLFPHGTATDNRVYFGTTPVDRLSMTSATHWLLERLMEPRRASPPLVMGPNAFLVALAARNTAFAAALGSATLSLPDGMSVVWGGRLLSKPLPERVPGGEFMEQMCALCGENGLSVYLLGGLPGAAEGAAKALTARYPGLRIAGTDCPALGFEHDDAANCAVRKRIEAARPDLLCVAFGAPKQELWMVDECPTLPIGAALSVGAAFDTQAGLRKRAPRWTHNIGLEWLYRLAMEPRRLWRRYLIGNAQFARIVAREWMRQRQARALDELLHPERDPRHASHDDHGTHAETSRHEPLPMGQMDPEDNPEHRHHH